jgi:molybdate transport system ATP-binding protein
LSGPRILLLDEPLTSLDQARRDDLLDLILKIRDQMDIPILYVTHDVRETERLKADIVQIDF